MSTAAYTACSTRQNIRGMSVLTLLIVIFIAVLIVLQMRLWLGEGSVADVVSLSDKVASQQHANRALQEENERIAVRADALKEGLDEIESRAREDLGLIKADETFFLMVDDQKP